MNWFRFMPATMAPTLSPNSDISAIRNVSPPSGDRERFDCVQGTVAKLNSVVAFNSRPCEEVDVSSQEHFKIHD